ATGTSPAAGAVFLRMTRDLPSTVHIRVFAYVPSGPIAIEPDPTTNVLLMLTKAGSFDTMQIRIEGSPNAKRFGFVDNTTNTYLSSDTPFPFDVWTCIEWEVRADRTRVFSNSQEITKLTRSLASGRIIESRFGWASSSNQAERPLDLWLDEIIVAAEP